MSLSSAQQKVKSTRDALEQIQRDVSRASQKESQILERLSTAQRALKNSSPSSISARMKDIQKLQEESTKASAERAKLQGKEAEKRTELTKAESVLAQETQKDSEARNKKEQEEIKKREMQLKKELDNLRTRSLSTVALALPNYLIPKSVPRTYDIFISHASEDKDDIARPLFDALTSKGVSVWFDEAVLTVGDSLRRKIDEGLASSRFGVVVLSTNFFAKNWPQRELDGLFAREISGGKVILPIWHKISKDEVLSKSPMLADKVALNSSLQSVSEIADQLVGAIRPA